MIAIENPPISVDKSKSLKIDAIRFLAAFWVLLYHFHLPLFRSFLPHKLAFIGSALTAIGTAVFAGPAAVIVFFVISGYCIHNAYHKDVTLKPVNYYASRLVRIGLPLVIVLLVVQPFPTGPNYVESVLWSLYCEMAYYAIYPLLRPRFRYLGEMILGCTAAGALMVAIVHARGPLACTHCVYEIYGVPGTALLYAAGWIMGCFIAESQRNATRFESGAAYSPLTMQMKRFTDSAVALLGKRLVLLRVVVLAAGALSMTLMSTSATKPAFIPLVTPDISLAAFQFLAAIWIAAETSTGSRASIWPRLAVLGAWSYSLYLCHKIALSALAVTRFDDTTRFAWFIQVALALVISYTFYRLVERPSHSLSQRLRKYAREVPVTEAM
jgi:peptidoglycan/LPS O-acetylase OafA/YrhL